MVVAVEPVPDTIRVLRLNLKLNNTNNTSNVIVIDKAAWSKHEQLLIRNT